MKSLSLSIHQLVDFLLRKGDIDNRIYNRSSMSEGSRIHTAYQASQGESYLSEYPLKMDIVVGDTLVTLQGRADGIIKSQFRYIIDEIKTTVIDLKTFRDEQLEWHLGQAKCYAYIFAKEKEQDNIGVRLTYIRQGKEKDKMIEDYVFFTKDLEKYVIDLIRDYLNFYSIVFRHIEERRNSALQLEFPYISYRDGQKEMSDAIAKNISGEGLLFVEAPTGIGKTMSALYPSIKALAEDDNSKVFYLTAKSSGKEAAMNSLKVLKNNGMKTNEILLTAKDKICFCKDKDCNPDECPFARKYYEKIQGVLEYALLSFDRFDFQTIVDIAKENVICPFELELDLSLFCDVIVCDYNYVFDPSAYLKRYMDADPSHYIALVDEAHNLVDRSREMYSASLNYNTLKKAKFSVKHLKSRKLKNALREIGNVFQNFELFENGRTIISNEDDSFIEVLEKSLKKIKDFGKEENESLTKECTELSLEINSFLDIYELFNDNYLFYVDKNDHDITIRLFCLDASSFLKSTCESLKSVTMFSATLSPIEYYIDTLGGNKIRDPSLLLESPFDKNNLLILVAPKVSIKYKDRLESYPIVAKYIKDFIGNKVGNYFVYVPSYEYLEKIQDYLELGKTKCYFQEKDTSEQDKLIFLNNFHENPKETTVGFLVIGGSFSEGIDLVNDRLIGAVIVGVGAPKINFESDKIMEYYKEKELNGYDYAYLYPGMNKVMQAVGRVIRSETDRGAVLLIDERYLQRKYLSVFKNEWRDYRVVFSPSEVKEEVSNFFNK